MRSHSRELAGVTAGALLLTALIAAPVLIAPSARVFGYESVGRHHDPFTVMQQYEQPGEATIYTQPVTDAVGVALARVTGGVAAYNWLVLLSFPLSAIAAFLLARHLQLSPTSAAVAALLFAFSPFHLAHAAYHPHIAQVQWVPLYLLALWRCLDRATPMAVLGLAVAAACVTFSNFYGGLIAAIMTPFAIGAYVLARRDARATAWRAAIITTTALGAITTVALGLLWWRASRGQLDLAIFTVQASDPFKYSAKWWSYLVPPLAHPWLGAWVRNLWTAADVHEGLLEQQVTIGAGVILLGVIALIAVPWRRAAGAAPPRPVAPMPLAAPMLAVLAAVALIWSLSPERTIGGVTIMRPSALIAHFAPMFRASARFGVVVQLMAVLLAGLGLDALWRSGRVAARVLGAVLVVLAIAEYTVAPSAMSRDALPSAAHRFLMPVMAQTGGARALECGASPDEAASLYWLTRGRVLVGAGTLTECREPHFGDKLAANGFTYLIVRTEAPAGRSLATGDAPEGLHRVFQQPDSLVFETTTIASVLYTDSITGFSTREFSALRSWQWLSASGTWTIVNPGTVAVTATLSLELEAFHQPRHLQLRLDGRDIGTLAVAIARQRYSTAEMVVPPGPHVLTFVPIEAPIEADTVAHNGDHRALAIAVGDWRWTTREVRR